MKELLIEYVTTYLIHKMSKRKKKEPQGDNVAMVLFQGKGTINFGTKTSRCAIIVANWATLCIFAIRQRTTTKRM